MNLNFNGTQTTQQSVTDLIKNVENMFIVRPAGSNPIIGSGGFVFDILGDEEIAIDADITDHYTEKNSAIQDHVTHRPERFTLRGYVGELTDKFSNTGMNILEDINSLASIGGFMPQFAAQATQVYTKVQNVASKVGSVLNQAQNLRDLITQKSTSSNKQQDAFKTFYGFWANNQLLTIETPFSIFENMMIESIRAKQSERSNMVSDFSVTFKKMRFAETKIISPAESQSGDSPVSGGRLGDAGGGVVNKGTITGQTSKQVGGQTATIEVRIVDVLAPYTVTKVIQ